MNESQEKIRWKRRWVGSDDERREEGKQWGERKRKS